MVYESIACSEQQIESLPKFDHRKWVKMASIPRWPNHSAPARKLKNALQWARLCQPRNYREITSDTSLESLWNEEFKQATDAQCVEEEYEIIRKCDEKNMFLNEVS